MIERVWPGAECASSRSQRSYRAEAAEGCWSLPVGATQRNHSSGDMQLFTNTLHVPKDTCLNMHSQKLVEIHQNNTCTCFFIRLPTHVLTWIQILWGVNVFPLSYINLYMKQPHQSSSTLNSREQSISLWLSFWFEEGIRTKKTDGNEWNSTSVYPWLIFVWFVEKEEGNDCKFCLFSQILKMNFFTYATQKPIFLLIWTFPKPYPMMWFQWQSCPDWPDNSAILKLL